MNLDKAAEEVLSGLEDRSNIPAVFDKRPRVINQDDVRNGATPIYEDTIYITKYIDRLNTRVSPAKEKDFAQYPNEYRAFLNKQEQKPVGTPIDNLAGLTPAQKENLKARKVETLERLAECSQTVLSEIGYGALDLQTRAKEYLQQSKSGNDEELKATQEKNKELEAKIESLEQMIKEIKNEPSNNSAKRSKRNASNTKSNNGSNK